MPAMLAAAMLALLCSRWAGAGGAEPAAPGARPHAAAALVPRCCPPGARLSADALRADVLRAADVPAACVPAPDEPPWAPPVFAPARGVFLERGRLPQHWRLDHARVPACAELRVLRDDAAAYALLATSGRLRPAGAEPAAPGLPAERFCADARAALACVEDDPGPALVPRCCPAERRLSADFLGVDVVRAEDVAAACSLEADPAWAPLVYAPERGGFLDRGRLPQHWRVEHERVPACGELRVLREHAAEYALAAGSGRLQVRGAGAAALPAERFCVDAAAALVCAADAGGRGASKCCAAGHAYDGARCAAAAERGAETLRELRALGGGSAVAAGWPACAEGSQYEVAGALGDARPLEGGALQLGATRLAAGAWCAEAVGEAAGARVLVCAAPSGPPARSARQLLYGAGLAVGAAFLAATLAAGFALPAAHHALHWRCQTHYVAALMLGDALLAATQLAGERVPPGLCRALAVCMHFLFLSAFFWLNTMCFNIWWTFRDFRPTSLERGQEACRLRVYMVYAWGGPLLVAGAAALLDRLPAGAAPGVLRPRFAVQRCWFYGDMEILVYFFGPVGVLLLVNLALFVSTTRQLTCGLWRRDEVKSTAERAALGRVCAKLVVVMGVTWGADVVSWAAGGPEYVWYATDLLNALQGVFIFLVVGCQPHAWAALKRAAAAWCVAPQQQHSSSHLPSCGESLTHTTAAPAPPPAPAARLPMETVC